MSQVSDRVGTSSTGSTNAVDTSGRSSMSLSLIAWKPRIEEPSKPSPSRIIASSSVAAGMEKCCQVPGRSQNLTSTTRMFFWRMRSSSLPTSLVWGTRFWALVRAMVAMAFSRSWWRFGSVSAMPLRGIGNAGASGELQDRQTVVPAVRDRGRCGFGVTGAWLLRNRGRSAAWAEYTEGSHPCQGDRAFLAGFARHFSTKAVHLESNAALRCTSGGIPTSRSNPADRPHLSAADALMFTGPRASRGRHGGPLTLLVCSSCHAPLREGTAHCPRCGPGGLVLLAAEHPHPAASAGPDDRRGHTLERALGRQYRVVRLLGRGGFAEVYEGRDGGLQRRLAVKGLRA